MVQQQRERYMDAISRTSMTSRLCLRLFVILSSVVMTCACSDCSVLRPEMGFTNMVAPAGLASASLHTETLGQCYHRCVADVGCMSFFYNRISRICQLHTIVYLSRGNLLDGLGSDYYIINCDPCKKHPGYMLNRKLGICFAFVPFSPPYDLDVIRSHCRNASGGKLMVVDTEEKQVLLRDTARNGCPRSSISIGLTLSTTDDKWRWDDNKTLRWAQWKYGKQPFDTAKRCCFMLWSRDWDWNAGSCTQPSPKVAACEV